MLDVKVTGFDAQKWGLHEANVYDAVLADVPCSGERHLLENQDELKTWSPQRSAQLAVRQYAILTSALTAAKPGGRVVYSTCSISQVENDDVIAKLVKRRGHEFENVQLPPEVLLRAKEFKIELEPTEFGYWILPDRSENAGPIYFSLVRKSQTVSM
jgi:16S rRNA C967 or C1407 C5-methylase (RsmB/RsmF family)